MREQVITSRAGKVGASAKGRAGASAAQHPAGRRARPAAPKGARHKSFAWKSALHYVPAALKLVLAVSLGLLAFVGYRTAVSASFFKVKTVDVEGATRASREDIRAAVMRFSNAGVWQTDLDTVTRELRELPWVRGAVVTRVLPDGLRVRVTEREPRVIVRNREGKLVWADDDGVMLGAAIPGDDDFFFRGLDESNAEGARRDNRARMAAALELKGDWEKSGMSKRVSEADLSDLRDVRVHLAGDDAGIQVVLGEKEYVRRFRNALEKLDEGGRVRNGICVTYINMTSGRNATLGTRSCADMHAVAAISTEAARDVTDAGADAKTVTPARAATQSSARTHAAATAKKNRDAASKKKESAAKVSKPTTRPRRVG